MSQDFLLDIGKIIASVALLGAVLAGVSWLSRRLALQPEVGRKIIHVSLGLYCLTFPAVFDAPWQVAATCALALGVFLVARRRPKLGGGLHAVERSSYGELLFAVSVALLFYLKDGHYILTLHKVQQGPQLVLYVLPLLILSLCDAASALVGVNYGRNQFRVEEGVKSIEGVATFVVTAWLLSLIALLLLTDLPKPQLIVLALIVALFGALFEAASWRGLDNLFIPIGLYFIVANLMHRSVPELAVVTGAFIAATGVLLAVGGRLGVSRHVVASGVSLLFCIAIFAGPLALLAPCLAFAAYYAVWRRGERRDVPHDGLDLITTAMALALFVFLLSGLIQRTTILAFNLVFACMAAGMLTRFGRLPLPALAAAVAAIAALALVRIAIQPPPGTELPLYALGSSLLVLLAAGVGAGLKARSPERPWLKLGLVSAALGLLALPLSELRSLPGGLV